MKASQSRLWGLLSPAENLSDSRDQIIFKKVPTGVPGEAQAQCQKEAFDVAFSVSPQEGRGTEILEPDPRSSDSPPSSHVVMTS
jgi:hypothetical protein